MVDRRQNFLMLVLILCDLLLGGFKGLRAFELLGERIDDILDLGRLGVLPHIGPDGQLDRYDAAVYERFSIRVLVRLCFGQHRINLLAHRWGQRRILLEMHFQLIIETFNDILYAAILISRNRCLVFRFQNIANVQSCSRRNRIDIWIFNFIFP